MSGLKKCGAGRKAAVLLPPIFLALFGLLSLMLPDQGISLSERRPLADFPALSASSWADGSFGEGLEAYLKDQFVCRDLFRGIKAEAEITILGERDSGGYYREGGGIYRVEQKLREDKIIRAAKKFTSIAADYFPEADIFFSVIPDKEYYLADQGRKCPHLDFAQVELLVKENIGDAVYIPISGTLELEDYYRTDLHWRQECIGGTAGALLEAMGSQDGKLDGGWEVGTALQSFRGSNAGASAFFTEPETLCYVTDPFISGATVYDYEKDTEVLVYAREKLEGADPYDFFLWGPRALLTVRRTMGEKPGKRLLVFRDSFGSSIAPLLLRGYEEVTLVDLRYVTAGYAISLLGDTVYDDVLFLYSATVLNHSDSLRL